jgi:hypothetical protein
MEIYLEPIELPNNVLMLNPQMWIVNNNIPHLTDIIGCCYLLDFTSNSKNKQSQILIHTKDTQTFYFIKKQKEMYFLTTHQSINKGFFYPKKSDHLFDTRIVIYKGIELSDIPDGFERLGLEWVAFNYISKKIIELESGVAHDTSERLKLEWDRENKLKNILEN